MGGGGAAPTCEFWFDVGVGVEGEGHVVLHPEMVEDGRVLVLHILLAHLHV